MNDALGIISHAHAVKVPRRLRAKQYPDFLEKVDKPMYKSRRVIGKLFHLVKNVELKSHSHSSSIKSFTAEVASNCYDPDMEVDGFEDYIDDAINYKRVYDNKLRNLMDYYGIKTEADILSGNITSVSKFFDRRKDLESINYAVRSLIKEARTWFNATRSDSCTGTDDVCAAKASAWYHVTYHPRYWGRCSKGMERDHFLSFPWCVFDMILQIKRNK